MDKRNYTPREVSELLRVSPTTVMKLIHDGRLFAVHVSDRVYRIPIGAVARLQNPATVNHEPSVTQAAKLAPLGETVDAGDERLVTA